MRIMVDTNVIISAILFPESIPSAAIIKVLKQHRLVLCSQIEDELFAIFERRSQKSGFRIKDWGKQKSEKIKL